MTDERDLLATPAPAPATDAAPAEPAIATDAEPTTDAALAEPEPAAPEPEPEPLPIHEFDDLLGRVRAALPPSGGHVAEIPPTSQAPVAIGEHAGRGVILKSRTAVELGGGPDQSCVLALTTADVSLVRDGRVTVYGPDVSQAPAGSVLPFAQLVLVAGEGLAGPCHQGIEDCLGVKDFVEGLFLRNAPGEAMIRVGTKAYEAGFLLGHLASAQRELIMAQNPKVESVEVVFVTSSAEDVAALAAFREEWKRVSHDLRRDAWKQRGVDIDCPTGGHCGSCKDKDVCTQVRTIQKLRKMEKEGAGGCDCQEAAEAKEEPGAAKGEPAVQEGSADE